MTAVLEVDNIVKSFVKKRNVFGIATEHTNAVKDVSFTLEKGRTRAIVGESGAGKSTIGRMALRLDVPDTGAIRLFGDDILKMSAKSVRQLRSRATMIFQDPFSSLNPRHTVGAIIAAPYEVQGIKPPGGVKQAVRDLMDRVGLNPEHVNRYPYEFSGGQRQRIGIARAIALRPKLIICDEPVSALDVSIQAQILNLLQDLQSDFGVSYLFIAHDLAVVEHVSDHILVMSKGRIVEQGTPAEILGNPQQAYTKTLLAAVPRF